MFVSRANFGDTSFFKLEIFLMYNTSDICFEQRCNFIVGEK